MARRLANYIDSFCTYAATYNTTPLFARYAAIWMIGTAVGRGIGMMSRGNELHPNFFFQLVGGPGTGKSQAVKAVRKVFIPATGMSIIPASITRAGMEDYMAGNLKTRKTPDGKLLLTNECIGLSEEMQGILPDQGLDHLTLYNILYDLPSLHVAQTRSNGEVRLESPYCSILTGAQPAFLATTMPEQAWGMGFMSRSMMIFDVQRPRTSMFVEVFQDHKLLADLIHDLRELHNTQGWMHWSKPAQNLYEEWYVEKGGQPVPQAKRLAMGYNARRELHMVKLAMVMSLARGSDLMVELKDVAEAIKLLLLTEERMKAVFTEMSNTGSTVAIEEVIDIVRDRTAAGEVADEALLIELLMQRFPATQVHAVIENLISSRAIRSVTAADTPAAKGALSAKGFRKFMAGPKVAVLA